MLLGVRMDADLKDFINKHVEEIEASANEIGNVLDGKNVHVGMIALQIAYLAIINDLDQETRKGAIMAMIYFLTVNEDRAEIPVH